MRATRTLHGKGYYCRCCCGLLWLPLLLSTAEAASFRASTASSARNTTSQHTQVKGGLEERTIIGLASGDCHMLALDEAGKVYGWGSFKDRVKG